MLRHILKFIAWVCDVGQQKTYTVVKRSITGKPTLVTGNGYLLKHTDEGLQGAHTAIMITQFGAATDMIKKVLQGECDDYLDNHGKEAIIANIRDRVNKGGEYFGTVRNSRGTLDFVKRYWSAEDLFEIRHLLTKYDLKG